MHYKKLIWLLFFICCNSFANDLLKPFPQKIEGFERFVITLEPLPQEDLYQVELLVGKEINIDCNRSFFSGALRTETVQDWGYTYYVVDSIKGPTSTLMACPASTTKTGFVIVNLPDHTAWLRYNSKLPIVIFVPKTFAVRYRTWKASDAIQSATSH